MPMVRFANEDGGAILWMAQLEESPRAGESALWGEADTPEEGLIEYKVEEVRREYRKPTGEAPSSTLCRETVKVVVSRVP